MKSSLAAEWSSPAPLSFPFYSVIPPCLFVCLFLLPCFCLFAFLGFLPWFFPLPLENILSLALTLLFFSQCPVHHPSFHPSPVLSLSWFLLCAPFPAVSSTLFSFVLFFMRFLHFPTPCLQWGVFPLHILCIHSFFSFLFPWYSFSCLRVRVQFECLIRYLFTGFPEQALWLLCRAWFLLDPSGRFIPGLGLYHSILGRSSEVCKSVPVCAEMPVSARVVRGRD